MKCALFLAPGFEESEALVPADILRRAEVETELVSVTSEKTVRSSHGFFIQADLCWDECDPGIYDGLILPGGKAGTAGLRTFEPLLSLIQNHMHEGKLIGAICAAPSILGELGLLKGRRYTCFPEFYDSGFEGEYCQELAVTDGNLVTGRGMGASIAFARELVKSICPDRLDAVDYGIQYEHRFRELI